jgi:HlyD family secretion protein
MAMSRKKKIIIGAVAGVVLLAIVIGSILATRQDTPEVTVVKIETKPELRSTVTSSGEVRPIQFMNLTSEVQGRIEEIYVKEGQMVNKGDPLVRLDPNQLESSTEAQTAAYQSAQTQISAAQNQLAQAQQGLNVAQVAIDNARQGVVTGQTEVDRAQVEVNAANRELKRSEQLLESGVISRQEYDSAKDRAENARVSFNTAKARLESQRIAVKDATARLQQQEVSIRDARTSIERANKNVDQQSAVLRGQRNQLGKTLQVAPISGVVAEIPSRVGTFAVASLSSTALMTIADMSTINVEVKVDETEIDKVAVGQKAKIKVDAFGDQEIEGEVTQKTPLAVGKSQTTGGITQNINVQEAKEFRVVIQLQNLTAEVKNGLRPGMSATATITTKTQQNVLAVPLQAIVEKKQDNSPSPGAQSNAPAPADKPKPIKGVYVLDGNKAKFRQVETGITGESEIQILSGLSAGEEVITGPSRILNTLKEDSVVKKQTKKEGENANKS